MRSAVPYCASILARKAVRDIAGQDLVGQGKTVRGDDQGDDHLDAIGAFIPAVAEGAFPMLRWVALEVGAGQVVEQHVKAGIEEAAPAFL